MSHIIDLEQLCLWLREGKNSLKSRETQIMFGKNASEMGTEVEKDHCVSLQLSLCSEFHNGGNDISITGFESLNGFDP